MTLAHTTTRNPIATPSSRRWWTLLFCLLLIPLCFGCSRNFWRRHADRENYRVLAEKMTDERWVVPRVDLRPDPRSRFYDPYDPDEPPLPPDDPDAHQYMHWVHGMLGYQSWHEFGDTFTVENPQWLENFGIPGEVAACGYENGYSYEAKISRPVPTIENMTLGDAIELTYIHSRDFQFQLERLYLIALQLTFERFRFDVQFLGIGGNKPSSDLVLDHVPGEDTTLGWDNRIGIRKLMPTGGQWAVEFINNTLWLFSGDNKTNTASTLSFGLVQPLLLGGGRKVALENLTQSERDALYEMRSFARFRKIFFVDVVGGNSGFLGLLGLRQAVINQENNIREIEVQVRRLRALSEERPRWLNERLEQLPAGIEFPAALADRIRYDETTKFFGWNGEMTKEERDQLLALSDNEAYQIVVRELYQRTTGDVTSLEVAQLETDLAQGRSNLLANEVGFADSLDQYKIQIGIPTDSIVTIDESLLKPFELIDPQLRDLQDELDNFWAIYSQINDLEPEEELLKQTNERLLEMRDLIETEGFKIVRNDFTRLEAIWDHRMETLDEEGQLRLTRDVARDRRIMSDLVTRLALATEELKAQQSALSGAPLNLDRRTEVYREIAELQERLLGIVQGLTVVQINVRVELIELSPSDISMEDAVRLGMQNRLDLKNERAFVMDARRKLEVAANNLEAVLDVIVEGDIRTQPLLSGNNKPLDFRGVNSNYRAGLAFTAPVVQISERNVYRATLIEYQRARRAYMLAEDRIKQEIRNNWRGLEANRAQFEIGRQAVRSAAIQFDQSVDQISEPLGANQSRSRSIGLNLLQALNAILGAQNGLIRTWVSYETSRLNLNRDMGIMQIDETGVWNDPFYQERKAARPSFISIPPDPNIDPSTEDLLEVLPEEEEFLNDLELQQRINRLNRHPALQNDNWEGVPPAPEPEPEAAPQNAKPGPELFREENQN